MNSYKSKKCSTVQSAANANMILNFGRNIVEEIHEQQMDYHIVYSRQQPNKEVAVSELSELNATLHETNIPQYLSFSAIIQIPLIVLAYFRVLKKIKPDIIHTRGTMVGFVGRIAAKIAGVPFIYHHQDDFLHREETMSNNKKLFFKNIDKALARISNKVFFVSDTIMQEADEIGINKDKCMMVGHDLHPNFVKSSKKKFDKLHPIVAGLKSDNNTLVVGTITRLEDFKGIDTIFSVAKHFKKDSLDIKFLIRGNGSKKEKYKAEIKDNELSDIVYLVSDYLPAEEIPWLFKSFDMFFLPTRREGFGMVFAEAMSMGVPVIAPKIYPVIEVVPEKFGYVIESENVKGYVDAIKQLYSNKEKRHLLSIEGQKYALQRWGKRRSAKLVISEMLNN